MNIFDDGICDGCDNGEMETYSVVTKVRAIVHCDECLGTRRKLSSLGKELVEFLRDIKVKV